MIRRALLAVRGLSVAGLVSAAALSASAAELEVIPLAIVPGTVRFDADGSDRNQFSPVLITLPFSTSLNVASGQPGCASASFTYSASPIGGGIEVHLDGIAVANAAASCGLNPQLTFDVVLAVPDYGAPTQPFMLEMEVVQSSFAALPFRASGQMTPDVWPRSSLLGRRYFFGDYQNGLTISASSPSGEFGVPSIHTALSGDTLSIPMRTFFDFSSNGTPTSGVLTLRFFYKTLRPTDVPEPAAGLSLPMGALALAGLARAR